MILEELTYEIRGAIFEVYKFFGPGLFESVYKAALETELKERRLAFKKEILVPAVYKNITLDVGFRLDLIVEDQVITEIKSVEELHNVHKKQLLTYLKLLNKRLGFLVNFNSEYLVDKESLIRIIN